MQDTEILTAAETKRASEKGARYLIAVVSDLEAGRTQRVRIFSNPLKHLDYCPDRQIRLSGILKKKPMATVPTPSLRSTSLGAR